MERLEKLLNVVMEKWTEGMLGQEIKPRCLESRNCVASLCSRKHRCLEKSSMRTCERKRVPVKNSDNFSRKPPPVWEVALNQNCWARERNDSKARIGKTRGVSLGSWSLTCQWVSEPSSTNRTEESQELLPKAPVQIPQDPRELLSHPGTGWDNTITHSCLKSEEFTRHC